MLHQNTDNINTSNEINISFISAIKELKVSKILNTCGIRKLARRIDGEASAEKRTAFEIFQFLLIMVFQGCNLHRFLGSKKQDIACSKSTYHRFLNDCHYNWRRFVTMLAANVVASIDRLTDNNRFKAFVLDDSVIGRKRSKRVELLSYVFDHVAGKSVKGFNLLTLGWTDGFSFIPVAFNMLSSAKASKRLNNINESIDKRTVGYRNRKTAIMRKPDAAIAMIREALDAGIFADYVIMDTWFTNEPFIKRLRDEGLDVIGMLKDNRQLYHYRNKLMNLRTLAAHHVRMVGDNNLLGSVVVRTHKCSIPVKLVFVRNRNKRNEYIIILSTDCALSDEEIVRRYSARWSIECCFKVCKSMLKLGKEFQPINYDTTVSSTALVFTRFIILEWIRRKNSDYRTLGDLFFLIYEEVRDLELSDALEKLVSILAVGIAQGRIQVDEVIRAELLDWYISQPIFIQSLCQSQLAEAGLTQY